MKKRHKYMCCNSFRFYFNELSHSLSAKGRRTRKRLVIGEYKMLSKAVKNSFENMIPVIMKSKYKELLEKIEENIFMDGNSYEEPIGQKKIPQYTDFRTFDHFLYNLAQKECVNLTLKFEVNLNISVGKFDSKRLINLRPNIGFLQNLQHLDLSCNELLYIPEELCELHKLKTLNLRKNFLLSLPKNIGKLTNLLDLDISENYISRLPPSTILLKNLQSLNLRINSFTKIPKEIGYLLQLKLLLFEGNAIKDLPSDFFGLFHLRHLDFDKPTEKKQSKLINPSEKITLEEIAARKIFTENINVPYRLNKLTLEKIRSVQECCVCYGPYFDYSVTYENVRLYRNTNAVFIYDMCKNHIKGQKSLKKYFFEKKIVNPCQKLVDLNFPRLSYFFSFDVYDINKLNDICKYKEKGKKCYPRPLYTLSADYKHKQEEPIEEQKDVK